MSLNKQFNWALSEQGRKAFETFISMGLDEDLAFELVIDMVGEEQALKLEDENEQE